MTPPLVEFVVSVPATEENCRLLHNGATPHVAIAAVIRKYTYFEGVTVRQVEPGEEKRDG